jgi:hypothetical protein
MVLEPLRTWRPIARVLVLLAMALFMSACGKKPKQGLTLTNATPIGAAARQVIVYISFDRALDPSTWPTSFSFEDNLGATVGSNISFNSVTNQIAIQPTAGALAGATTFTVTVLGTLKGADGTTFSGAAFQFTTPIGTPTNGGQPTFVGVASATASATPGTIVLAWATATDAPDSDAIQYDVYMSTVLNGVDFSSPPFMTTSNATGLTINGLASGMTFFFAVRAKEATTGNIEFNTAEASATTN